MNHYVPPSPAESALRSAISACPRNIACDILLEALSRLSIRPVAPLFGLLDEARTWAAVSTVQERKAYCLACFDALPHPEQLAFIAYVQRRFT